MKDRQFQVSLVVVFAFVCALSTAANSGQAQGRRELMLSQRSAAQATWALVYWQRREVVAIEAVCGCGGGSR